MSKREAIRKELVTLYQEGAKLAGAFEKKQDKQFELDYQRWYTKALSALASLAPDRHLEFRSYYEINPKRKDLGYGNYVIQDFVKRVAPGPFYHNFDTRAEVLTCFFNQLTILNSVTERLDSVVSNIEGELYAELQDNEIAVARTLSKVSLRAAGALIGVVIEGHLQKVAANHSVKVAKKHPTIGDLNDPLKTAGIIDIPTWRRITLLADLRNLCAHKKDAEPTKEQVEDLIVGAEWLAKTVF
jgi:hypothetical protein